MNPMRSILYMPASNTRALNKISQLDADAYILDLEDAVSPRNKDEARKTLVNALSKPKLINKQIIARVNGLDSIACEKDLAALASLKLDALLFPKIENQQDVLDAIDLMEKYRYLPEVELWIMIETTMAVINIETIVEAHPRLHTLIMGTSDLANEMAVPHSREREGLLYAISRVLFYAKAYHKGIFDGVHLDLNDDDGFNHSCHQGKNLGFEGKTLIHPKQITVCNHVFSPSPEELSQAQAIVELWQTMEAEKTGVAVLNGKLIEKLHVDQARHLLEIYGITH